MFNAKGGNCHRIALISVLYLQELRLWITDGLILVCVNSPYANHSLLIGHFLTASQNYSCQEFGASKYFPVFLTTLSISNSV